jgi:hypothetical protein
VGAGVELRRVAEEGGAGVVAELLVRAQLLRVDAVAVAVVVGEAPLRQRRHPLLAARARRLKSTLQVISFVSFWNVQC